MFSWDIRRVWGGWVLVRQMHFLLLVVESYTLFEIRQCFQLTWKREQERKKAFPDLQVLRYFAIFPLSERHAKQCDSVRRTKNPKWKKRDATVRAKMTKKGKLYKHTHIMHTHVPTHTCTYTHRCAHTTYTHIFISMSTQSSGKVQLELGLTPWLSG